MPCTSINYQYMAEEIPKLIGHWGSSFVSRVRIALHLKGLEYHFLEESIGSNGQLEKSQLLLQSNPVYKKIPVFIHNGNPICESSIIVEYIDDVWPMHGLSILPLDPFERAHARFWGTFIDKAIIKFFTMLRADSEEAKTELAKSVIKGLSILEGAFMECSKGKSFYGGDNIGYIDIAFGSNLGWIRASEDLCGIKLLDSGMVPNLVGWADDAARDKRWKDVPSLSISRSAMFSSLGRMPINELTPSTTLSRLPSTDSTSPLTRSITNDLLHNPLGRIQLYDLTPDSIPRNFPNSYLNSDLSLKPNDLRPETLTRFHPHDLNPCRPKPNTQRLNFHHSKH